MDLTKQTVFLPLGILIASGVANAQFLPDLKPTSINAPSDIAPLVAGTISSTIKNDAGFFPSGPTTSGYYLSKDSQISSSDILLTSWTTPLLVPGSSHSHSASVTFPVNTPEGASHVAVWANSSGVLLESSTSNNKLSTAVTGHAQPDLSVASVEVAGSTWGRGEEVEVTGVIENEGGILAFDLSISLFLGPTLLDSWNQNLSTLR